MRFWGCDLESIYDWNYANMKSFLLSTDKAACLGSFLHTSSIDTATMMNYTFDVDNGLSVTNDSDEDSCQRADGGVKLVCPLNLWRMELFKYMRVCQAAMAHVGTLSPPHCRH